LTARGCLGWGYASGPQLSKLNVLLGSKVPLMACETMGGAVLQTDQWAIAGSGDFEGQARAGPGQKWPVLGGLSTARWVHVPASEVYMTTRCIHVAAQALKRAP